MRAYRIRVYGQPRKNIDAHQLAQALLMVARELRAHQSQQEATKGESVPPENAGPDDA